MCIVGLRRRAAALWLLVSALEACCALGGRGPAAISRRRSLLEARSRARCSATEPRFLEGEEAALVALEMGEGGSRLMFPLFLVGEELVLPSLEEGGEEEGAEALLSALESGRFLEGGGMGGFLTAEERAKERGEGGTSG